MCETRHRVKDAGRFAWVDSEPLRDVVSDTACGDDGNGVVGGADVDQTHQCCDAIFGSTLSVDVAGEAIDDVADASIVAYHRKHAACQEGHDDEFAHAHHSVCHAAKPSEHIVGSTPDADDAGYDDADCEDE